MQVLEQFTELRLNEGGQAELVRGQRWVELPGVVAVEDAIALEALRQEAGARSERNRKLAESDWTASADVPMDEMVRADWLAYRQALRDVPQQAAFPSEIAWPTKP